MKKSKEALRLPSAHQHGDKVNLCLMPKDEKLTEFPPLPGIVTGIHFYPGKVKYDIEIDFYGEYSTRIYNVDSILVVKRDE